MSKETLLSILKKHRLRNTDCRQEVLSLFLATDFALSNADIEKSISQNYDRVTIYRTLKNFLEKGIIHKVLDDIGNPKYALCKEQCSPESHNHQHVHFKCVSCGQTNCLENIQIPQFELPQGYQMLESNILINGICQACH